MSQRITGARARKNSRRITYLWIAVLVAVTVGLIYYEQTEVLYILATLGVTAFLVVVGLADLSGAQKSNLTEGVVMDDSAAIANNLASPTPAPVGTRKPNASKRR
jgi:hypothetical protein